MTGKDLRCPECGAEARDVHPDAELNPSGEFLPPAKEWGVMWTCRNGHRHISGVRDRDRGFVHMRCR